MNYQNKVLYFVLGEAVQEHPELVKKYLGSVIPTDNYFACLNPSVYRCPVLLYSKRCKMSMELSLHTLELTQANTGQFERTLNS